MFIEKQELSFDLINLTVDFHMLNKIHTENRVLKNEHPPQFKYMMVSLRAFSKNHILLHKNDNIRTRAQQYNLE